MKRLLGSLAIASIACIAFTQQVSLQSILQDGIELSKLAKRPKPYFSTSQASSYDRASVAPGSDSWFANNDAGNFVRVETREGRTERVMADLKGPGAVVRIWSANPAGNMRFYFDGEESPRWTVVAKDLLSGKVSPFGMPFAYESSRGFNFYAPLPYQKSLKITVDDAEGDGSKSMYYHVGYRTYEAGTSVATFDPGQVDAELMARYGRAFQTPYTPLYTFKPVAKKLTPAGVIIANLPKGPQAVSYLWVKVQPEFRRPRRGQQPPPIVDFSDPRQMHNILRQTVIEADFDGQACVRAPLGDFFGSAPGLNFYNGFPMSVTEDGAMICRFVMPYQKSGIIRFRNTGAANVELQYFIETLPYPWDADTYHFKAQFNGDSGKTRPMKDMTFLSASGEGVLVGTSLQISNPVPDWWGEGDEKIFVDGATFPSIFGTGTEDFFGFAWCSNQIFARPFHAQPRADKPGNFGQSSSNRWLVLDSVPFQKSLKFDMEMWHWADVNATYARTTYWYGKPGGSGPKLDSRYLRISEMKLPDPVKGAIEGENLEIVSQSGGQVEKQSGFWQPSGGLQLWWRDAAPGAKLVVNVPAARAGRYRVTANFCFAPDYGIARLTMGGRSLEPMDFYSSKLEWRTIDLGIFDLVAGPNALEVEISGTNSAASPPRYMFGVDYLKLDRVGQ